MKTIVANTVRRCGTIFLTKKILEQLDVNVIVLHEVEDISLPSFTILREPVDCLKSAVVLDIFHVNKFINHYEDVYEDEKNRYIKFLNHVKNSADIFFDFNDLDKSDAIIKTISNKFEIPYAENPQKNILNVQRSFKDNTILDENGIPKEHMYSSKNHEHYNFISDFIDSKNSSGDLDEAKKIFDELIKLTVKLS